MKRDYLFYLCEIERAGWSFKSFVRLANSDQIDRETLNNIGRVLMEYKGRNQRRIVFSFSFFEAYGEQIAGYCGCSQLLYDHLRLKVNDFQPVINFCAEMIRKENFTNNYTRTATALVSTFQIDLSTEYVRRLLAKEMVD